MNCQKIFLLLSMNAFVAKSILGNEVQAVDGRIAILECPASILAQKTSAKPTLLRWFHSRYHKPIYTLDVRIIDPTTSKYGWSAGEAKHFPSSDFDGRLYLEVLTNPLALRIDPVLYEDHGRYTCRIDFRGERSVSSFVDLQVVVPPKDVIIRDQNGRKVESVIGPFTLGEALMMTCESIGGKPSPKLKWSGRLLDTDNEQNFRTYEVNSTQNTTSILIPCLTRNHQWSHYTCTAENSHLIKPNIATATIELNLPPLEIEIESDLLGPLEVGRELLLTCKSVGSHPRAHIRWCIEGVFLKSREIISNNGNLTISYLKRNVSKLDNGKYLECIATNPSLPNYIMKKTYYMEVLYKPEITIIVSSSSNNRISATANVTLQCSVLASPNICKITWFFNGEQITNSPVAKVQHGNLTLQEIRRTQTGTYVCQAENTQGKSSSSTYISVRYAPVCQRIEIAAQTFDAHDREIANVTCNLQSNPQNVTYRWMSLNSSFNHSWSSGRDSWSAVELEDATVDLLCWGENEVGLQEEPCILQLPPGYMGLEPFYDKEALLVAGFAVIFCILGILIVSRKFQRGVKTRSTVDCEQMRSFTDRGCGQMINNCVKSTNNATESECLTTLLNSEETSEQAQESRQRNYGVLLKNDGNTQPRRIKSTQF